MTTPINANDIVFGAKVDDQTTEFFRQFDENVKRLAENSERGFARIDKSIDSAGVQIGILGGLFAALTQQVIQFAMQAIAAIKSFVQESIALTARVDQLGVIIQQMGANAGYSAEEIAHFEEQVKSMGITTAASRQALTQMAQANLDWADAARLARIAQDAATIANINSSQAFEYLINAIQKRDTQMLRSMGILVDQSSAQQAYAAEVGKTTAQLTEQEKTQAFMNAAVKSAEAIFGSYEASMESAGKKAGSMARHYEELQLAIGAVFQPAYGEIIDWQTDKLRDMRDFVDANSESLEKLADVLGKVTSTSLTKMTELIDLLTTVPEKATTATRAIATVLNDLTGLLDPEELNENMDNVLENILKAITLNATFVSAGVGAMVEGFQIGMEGLKSFAASAVDLGAVIRAAWSGDSEEIKATWETFLEGAVVYTDSLRDVETRLDRMKEAGRDSAASTYQYFGEIFGLLESEGVESLEAIEEAADGIDFQLAINSAMEFLSAVAQVEQEVAKLHTAFMEDFERRATVAIRKEIEDALRLSHRIEDIERGHAERLAKLRDSFEGSRIDIDTQHLSGVQNAYDKFYESQLRERENYALRLLRIEQSYQDRLEDIRTRFEYDSSELARDRDAVGLRRLVRRTEQELQTAETAAERQRRDAEIDFQQRQERLELALQKELVSIEENIQKQHQKLEESYRNQLQNLEESRQEQYTALARAKDREQQLRELREAWAEQDRQAAYQKQLQALGAHMLTLNSMTSTGLDGIIARWQRHYGDLSGLITGFNNQLELQNANTMNSFQVPYAQPFVPPTFGAHSSLSLGGNFSQFFQHPAPNTSPTDDVTGAGGQISSHLTAIGSNSRGVLSNMYAQAYSTVPSVKPQKSTDRREIHVTADIQGMDVTLQRMLVNTLTEIERTR